MSMRLHHNAFSPHSRRVRIAAIELGTDIEFVDVDFQKGEHKAPELMKHNPNGKVPVLEDGNFWLWESNAIMTYLAEKTPAKGLYPTDAQGRADVQRWLLWDQAHFGNACSRIINERVLKPMRKETPDATLVADAETHWNRFGAVLNAQLEGKQYVTGNTFTIADIALATPLFFRTMAQFNTKQFPHMEAWLTRLESRDSWTKTAPKM